MLFDKIHRGNALRIAVGIAMLVLLLAGGAGAAPTDLITGIVRDQNTGLPIQNAGVFFYGSAYGTVFTDTSGKYTFTASDLSSFGGAISGTLYVGATGYFEALPVSISDLGAQPSLPVVRDISLIPGGTVIRGTVRDTSTGLGISGATVSFSRNPMSSFRGGATSVSVQTNADGSYSIDSSYFNENGLSSGFSANLRVNANGYLGATRSISFSDYPTTADFNLLSSSGPLITGIVRDQNTGLPIQNAGVFFYGSAYGTVFTDTSGKYTFTASDLSSFGGAISGTLYVGATGYFEALPVSISDLGAQPSLPVVRDISLIPGGTVIRGTVRDTSTGLGISGATVSFSRNPMSSFRGGATSVSVQTNADGSYSIDSSYFNENGLSSGFSANLRVNANGYLGANRPISFSDYPTTADFSLLSSSGPLITGIVRDQNTGLPIQNAGVFFYGSAYGTVFTDTSGKYTFTASDLSSFGGAISGTLYVGATGYFEALPVSISDLGAQPSLPVVRDISLIPGGTVIRGTVRDTSTGLGISGATVSFSRNPMSSFRGGATSVSVQTNADGSYSIDSSYFNENGLSSGFSANLRVNANGYLGANRPISFSDYPTTADFSLLSISPNPTIQDKSLIKVEGQPEVYWFQNNKLYWVTDWDVISQMSEVPGWDSVNTLPASEFDPVDYEQGPRFITNGAESDGLLIREEGHPEVYLIQGGEMHHFTSPEALLWNGYSFADVINVSTVIIGMFSSGSDISITQAIIDKYHEQGGEATFGAPAGTGEQPGDPDSSGVVCSYVNFQNGAIEYFTNGDQAGNAYAILNPFFDKWASMGYGKSVLGYPISDMSDTQTSSFGTPFKYQNFINGTERGALEYNLTSGEVFEIHGAIYATWSAMGYADSILGLVTSDERDAVPSFKGTTGRVSDFENGHLHWHSSGDHYMVTYMTYGDLDELYVSMGGTASWLGFPVMDQEERDGYGYCEFEGGYIEWDGSEYKAKAAIEIIKPGVVFEGTFDQFNYGTYPMIMEITSVDGLEFNGILHWPTLGDSKTKFRGNIDSVTNKIWFTEYEQIQGSSNIVLNGDYYADIESQTLSGYWNWPNGGKGGTFSITMSGTEAPTITVTSPNGREDWQVGTTHPIQWSYTGNIGSDVTIEILNDGSVVQTFTSIPIGNDGIGTFDWTAPSTLILGTGYQVRITSMSNSAYVDTSDEPFVVSVGYALIVAGKGGVKEQWSIDYGTTNAYRALRNLGFDDDHIFYLSDRYQDVDGDGFNEVDDGASLSNFRFAIETISGKIGDNSGQFILYLHGHGPNADEYIQGDDPYFAMNPETSEIEDYIHGPKLQEMLGEFSSKTQILAIFGTCMSGLWITDDNAGISGPNRIIITASHDNEDRSHIGVLLSSERFFQNLNKGLNVKEAYVEGMLKGDKSHLWLDDNGDRIGHPPDNLVNDGVLAASTQIGVVGTEKLKFTTWLSLGLFSPGELRVYDSQNRVTGLVNGIINEEIPNSIYDEENIAIFSPSDTYSYSVTGTDTGTYGLEIVFVKNGELISFHADDIPTSKGQNHLYSIDWDMLSKDENGVIIKIDIDGDGIFDKTITTNHLFRFYNITFLPPITTMDQYNLKDGSTLPIKFTARDSTTDEFIYDPTVNVTITNSTGHLVTYFTYGTGTDSVRINSEEEQYIANFHTKDYAINIGETYSVTVTFGEPDSLMGYDITYFTLIEGGKAKGKGN